jgi:hypothetical protein
LVVTRVAGIIRLAVAHSGVRKLDVPMPVCFSLEAGFHDIVGLALHLSGASGAVRMITRKHMSTCVTCAPGCERRLQGPAIETYLALITWCLPSQAVLTAELSLQ